VGTLCVLAARDIAPNAVVRQALMALIITLNVARARGWLHVKQARIRGSCPRADLHEEQRLDDQHGSCLPSLLVRQDFAYSGHSLAPGRVLPNLTRVLAQNLGPLRQRAMKSPAALPPLLREAMRHKGRPPAGSCP
jgi:hypothetical protein